MDVLIRKYKLKTRIQLDVSHGVRSGQGALNKEQHLRAQITQQRHHSRLQK